MKSYDGRRLRKELYAKNTFFLNAFALFIHFIIFIHNK